MLRTSKYCSHSPLELTAVFFLMKFDFFFLLYSKDKNELMSNLKSITFFHIFSYISYIYLNLLLKSIFGCSVFYITATFLTQEKKLTFKRYKFSKC